MPNSVGPPMLLGRAGGSLVTDVPIVRRNHYGSNVYVENVGGNVKEDVLAIS